jgi:hypothetical protein
MSVQASVEENVRGAWKFDVAAADRVFRSLTITEAGRNEGRPRAFKGALLGGLRTGNSSNNLSLTHHDA